MKIQYNAVSMDLRPETRGLVQEELSRVSEALQPFRDPTAHVEIEKSARKGGYGISVHIYLPTKSLFASNWGADIRSAVEGVAGKLERQARKHVAVLRKDEKAGAKSSRGRFAPVPAVPIEEIEATRDLEAFRDRVSDHMSRLHRVLHRELKLDPRAERAGSAVSIPDIGEEALVYVFEHFRKRPVSMRPDRWLVQRGLLSLDRELDRAIATTVESDAAPRVALEPDEWEELLEYPGGEPMPMDGHAADEEKASPDLLESRRAMRAATAKALKGMPDRLRKALSLRHVEGYDLAEIAYVLNSEEATVEEWLLTAEVTLQDALREWRV